MEWLVEDLHACLQDLKELVAKLAEHGREELVQAIELIETTVDALKFPPVATPLHSSE